MSSDGDRIASLYAAGWQLEGMALVRLDVDGTVIVKVGVDYARLWQRYLEEEES